MEDKQYCDISNDVRMYKIPNKMKRIIICACLSLVVYTRNERMIGQLNN